MRPGPKALGATLAALLPMLALTALSWLPYTVDDRDVAILRLSWRAPAKVEEACRTLSADELERLPVHMRSPGACRRRGLPHRLEVRVDGELVALERVRPAGAQGDRPIYVFLDRQVDPGVRRVHVRFAVEEDEARRERAGEGEPGGEEGGLELDAAVLFAPRAIVLITYDPTARRLFVRGADVP